MKVKAFGLLLGSAVMLCLALVLSEFVTAAAAFDWQQWRGPQRDGLVTTFKSPNAFDSLGEAFLTRGNHVEAIRNYERAVQLDPTFQSALDALHKLKKQ